MAQDKRDIFVTGADNIVRPVTVTLHPHLAAYGDYWRVTRTNTRRIAGQPLRRKYNQTVKIGDCLYDIVRSPYYTWTGKPRQGYFLVRWASTADCLKRN